MVRSPTARQAGLAGLLGGLLWAVTPLRQPIFGAGRTPAEGETFFRAYNLVLVAIALALTVALLRLRSSRAAGGRLFSTGWWVILAGHLLVLVGSVPAVIFGGAAGPLVKGGQDLGFLGAVVAGLGAFLVGLAGVRRRADPTAAWWLLLLTLPLGVVLTVLLTAAGVPEDYLGLPLTVLYGGAWIVLGWWWLRQDEA